MKMDYPLRTAQAYINRNQEEVIGTKRETNEKVGLTPHHLESHPKNINSKLENI